MVQCYHVCSVKSTIDRYKKACADSSNSGSVSEANAQYYQQEAAKLRTLIGNLQNSNRNYLGEALSSLNLRELRTLETRLEKGISKIRSKKVLIVCYDYLISMNSFINELLFAEIEYMQKREIDLHNDNMYLRAKIAENERAQQHMSLMPASDYEVMPSQPFDSRNFLQVNLPEPSHHYSRQEQTALQLG
ncbi:hypothetical protein HHK36_005226 [Tetracentron sinense]|uniref:K-box domain-containing protein n=1 Tax=Tetracentron sinense TaxID=13715 RepID=A0A835DM65_TETSI|nr:hypothetical protein HHK36_005226 [Tetracentron sinense]